MELTYVARQPVFDGGLDLMGYELFFRAGETDSAAIGDPSAATTSVLGSLVVDFGFEALVDGRRAFVNVPPRFIEEGVYKSADPERMVFELSVRGGAVFLADAVRAARDAGYSIALDGFVPGHRAHDHLVGIVDLVKIDVSGPNAPDLEAAAAALAGRGVTAIAQRVETGEQLERCRALGFDGFQGHFFARPDVLSRPTVSPERVSAARLLMELHRPDADARDIAEVIRRDIGLTYRLLTLVNSSFHGLRHRVENVPQAVMLLGLGTVTKYASVLTLVGFQGTTSEAVTAAIVRARMCELLAERTIRSESAAAFTVGLLSLLDAVMGLPLEDVVGRLPVSDRIRDALLRREGPLGDLLRQVEDYERGGAAVGPASTRLAPEALAQAYLDAVGWADQLRQTLRPGGGPDRTRHPQPAVGIAAR